MERALPHDYYDYFQTLALVERDPQGTVRWLVPHPAPKILIYSDLSGRLRTAIDLRRDRWIRGASPMTDNTADRDRPVALALALLDRQWPATPGLADAIGTSSSMAGDVVALESDPRYLIGRLQQALTALLSVDLPPMDALTSLLCQAFADAIAWRQHVDRSCRKCGQSLCDPCNADWDQADRYHALARALGAVGNLPTAATNLEARSGD